MSTQKTHVQLVEDYIKAIGIPASLKDRVRRNLSNKSDEELTARIEAANDLTKRTKAYLAHYKAA